MEIPQKCARASRRKKRLVKNRRKNRNKYLNKSKFKKNFHKQFSEFDTQSDVNTENKFIEGVMGLKVPDSFWETYQFAQDWQHKHQVAWWRSKCIALEHENALLKNKIREIVSHCRSNHAGSHEVQNYPTKVEELELPGGQNLEPNQESYRHEGQDNFYQETEEDNEELEFQVDEGMMKFLEQSVRHKKELKRQRELEAEEAKVTWVSHENDDKIRLEEATLLYGKDKSRIIAIETRMQVEIDQHKTQHQPEFWPIIPLKL